MVARNTSTLPSGAGLRALTLALLALLVFEFVYDWTGIIEDRRDISAAQAGADGALSEGNLVPLLNETPGYAEYFSAPVFSRERRPLTLIRVGSVTKSGAVDARLVLLGTIVTEDGRVALFRTERDEGVLRGGLGRTVAGWTIVELEPAQVKVSRDGETAVLILPTVDNGGPMPRNVRRRRQNDQ